MTANARLARMTLAEVAPELRPAVQRMPGIPVSSALARWFTRTALTLAARDRQYEGVQFEKRTTDQGIAVRLYTPSAGHTGAALLWIHGGGLVIGGAAQDDVFCADTARQLGLVVVSTEYRLAPEFPFPAALDDCYAAWTWLQASAAQLNVDPARVAVGGQSAGGGLAAGLAQRLHDAGGVQPAAQWLFCPMLDDRTAARYELDAIRHKIWDNRQNRCGWRAFLGVEPGAEQAPDYAAPARRNDLRGLPAAWIGSGDIELFFDEDARYAARLKSAGVDCAVEVVPGAPHGFESIAQETQLAQNYLARAREWLGQKLARLDSR